MEHVYFSDQRLTLKFDDIMFVILWSNIISFKCTYGWKLGQQVGSADKILIVKSDDLSSIPRCTREKEELTPKK